MKMFRLTLNSEGFSILEVIVSFLILSMTLIILLQGVSNNVNSHRISKEYISMLFTAKNILAELGNEQPLVPGIIRNNEDDKYSWLAEITPYKPKSFWVKVTVFSQNIKNGHNRRRIELETIKVQK